MIKAAMKKLFSLILVLMAFVSASAQGYYTQYYADKGLIKEAQEWMASGAWRNGFTAASPHPSVNAVEFYTQYKKNPRQWEALFQYLSHTDLLALTRGRHKIPGSDLTISVEDDVNRPLNEQRSESHYHHIDFQYVVKGVERFGIIDHFTSKANCAYTPDVIHYDYDVKKARFMDSNTKQFFIFFPGDWHIAKINNDTNDQNIRVVVIKVDYIK